jgi:hypothetical protein
MTKKGFPLFSLTRALPNKPKAGQTRIDGSFKFPTPWDSKSK